MFAAKIQDLVNKGVAVSRPNRLFVAFTFQMDTEGVRSCLDHPSVAGIILADEANASQLDDPVRVGYRFGPHGSRWHFPTAKAHVAVVLGASDSVGLRIAWTALRRGVTSFVFIEPDTGAILRDTIVALMTRTVGQSIKCPLARWSACFADWMNECWISVAAWWKNLPAAVAAWWNSFVASLPRSEEHIFAFRLRRMFRMARKIPLEIGVRTDTVLLIIQNLASGGSERQAVNTALMLKRAGRLRPVVVCARLDVAGSGFYRHMLENAGVEIVDLYKLDMAVADTENRKLLDLCKSEGAKLGHEIVEDLLRYLIVFLKLRPRIVHAFLDENNIKGGIAAALARVPKIILSTRSVAPDNFNLLIRNYMRPGYKIMLRRREVVFCSNSYVGGRDYRRWLFKPFLSIHVVPNGVDFDAFATRDSIDQSTRERLGIPPKALVVASVMRLSEEKQPVLWARAVIEISRRRPDVYFILVGDGPSRQEIEFMIERTFVAGRVRFISQASDVSALLRVSDIFLLTSRVEGLPNVLLEAQAVGLPVVTTPAGGAVETLSPGVTGLVAPNHTVSGVANTCLAILDDEALRARMARAAPNFVREKFSLVRMFRETMRLYEA